MLQVSVTGECKEEIEMFFDLLFHNQYMRVCDYTVWKQQHINDGGKWRIDFEIEDRSTLEHYQTTPCLEDDEDIPF